MSRTTLHRVLWSIIIVVLMSGLTESFRWLWHGLPPSATADFSETTSTMPKNMGTGDYGASINSTTPAGMVDSPSRFADSPPLYSGLTWSQPASRTVPNAISYNNYASESTAARQIAGELSLSGQEWTASTTAECANDASGPLNRGDTIYNLPADFETYYENQSRIAGWSTRVSVNNLLFSPLFAGKANTDVWGYVKPDGDMIRAMILTRSSNQVEEGPQLCPLVFTFHVFMSDAVSIDKIIYRQ